MWHLGVSTALPVSDPRLLTPLYGGAIPLDGSGLFCPLPIPYLQFQTEVFWGDKGCVLWKGTGETEPSVSEKITVSFLYFFLFQAQYLFPEFLSTCTSSLLPPSSTETTTPGNVINTNKTLT